MGVEETEVVGNRVVLANTLTRRLLLDMAADFSFLDLSISSADQANRK